MPEDNENNEQQQTAKKSSKLKLIIIGVIALVLIILILVVVYSLVLAPKDNEAAATQEQAPAAQVAAPAPMPQVPAVQQPQLAPMPSMDMGMTTTEIGQIYPIPTMNVNLADPTGITYLAITLALEFDPKNADLLAEIEAKMPRILDMIITVLSSKAYEEISTAQGKINLRNEFLRRINSMMSKGKLYNVYITGFTVQR